MGGIVRSEFGFFPEHGKYEGHVSSGFMLPFAEITVTGAIIPSLVSSSVQSSGVLRDVVSAMFHLKTFEATADDPSA